MRTKKMRGETHKSVDDLDSFLSLPTDGCCQLTVANRRQICYNIFYAMPKTYHHGGG